MRHLTALVLAALLAGSASAQAPTTTAQSAAARSAAEAANELFQAMEARDSTALARILHPAAVLVAVGPDGRARVTAGSIGEWIQSVARSEQPWRERFTEAPRVEVHGPLATVWARYDFYIGEQFSHCGTDAFQLVLDGDAWRLLVVTFTIEEEGCEARAQP